MKTWEVFYVSHLSLKFSHLHRSYCTLRCCNSSLKGSWTLSVSILSLRNDFCCFSCKTDRNGNILSEPPLRRSWHTASLGWRACRLRQVSHALLLFLTLWLWRASVFFNCSVLLYRLTHRSGRRNASPGEDLRRSGQEVVLLQWKQKQVHKPKLSPKSQARNARKSKKRHRQISKTQKENISAKTTEWYDEDREKCLDLLSSRLDNISKLHGWSSAVCSDATTRLYETLMMDLPVNQIKNTGNLDSPQVPLTFNRVWLMFGQSKSAENKTRSAVRPLAKWLFSLRSHRRGWSGSIFVSPTLASVWEHPAVFEARSSHSHWPWTVCSPPATIVQTEKT